MADERRVPVFQRFSGPNVHSNRGREGLDTLHPDPSESYLELVFVHSLLGDSRLTWTHENDDRSFWPEWLREDPTFSKTRIHTFGYNERPVNGLVDVSRLVDIGEELCQALEANDDVKSNVHNPIVFVAHSLGGLAVKAAIVHARQNVNLQELSRRFYYILFLATPHWEAADREMLSTILKACSTLSLGRDPDPEPNCKRVQKINDDFYSCSQGLKLCSVYEDVPYPVVPRKNARLRKEKEVPMKADHENLVRFQDPDDPRWDSIRSILCDVANEIKEQFEKPERRQSDLKKIAKAFGISENTDMDFRKHDRDKVPGSCEWLPATASFKEWCELDASTVLTDDTCQIYWLTGDPGCGKSVLSAHIVSHLRSLDYDVSFFFVKHGDVSKQTMSTLLKTLAFQQAQSSVTVRRSLLRLLDDESGPMKLNDVGTLWRQLFDRGIFPIEPEKCQYWVIDAIDEGHGFEDFIAQLRSLPQSYKVFITSRRDLDVKNALRHVDTTVVPEHVPKKETLQDIRKYLQHHRHDLHEEDPAKLQELIEKLIWKSEGSFLWIHLTVRSLRNYWTDPAINDVLNDVPDPMHTLYRDLLRKIANSPNRGSAIPILRWVICAVRPMTVPELATAFRLDTGTSLKMAATAIESICGPLVRLENNTVEVVHDTVREHLFNKGQNKSAFEGFQYDKAKSHERLAIICIAFVTDHFSHRARNAFSGTGIQQDAFLRYANENFSEHLAKGGWAAESGDTVELVRTLVDFFKGYVLYWIQHMAQEGAEEGLTMLTNTGKNIKAFVGRRMAMDRNTELAKQLEELQEWSIDLIHIVTVFGKELLKIPEAIRNIIPPLCPLKSRINSEVGNRGVGLQVAGNPHETWPDRISSVSFAGDYINALASCEDRYAVALRSEQIVVYGATTCQETLRIKTKEPIKRLQFAHSRHWLFACGRATLCVYDYDTGERILAKETANEVLALIATRDDSRIVTVSRAKDLESFHIQGEQPVHRKRLKQSKAKQPPQKAYMSEELGLLALLTRNEDVELYDLDTLDQPKARIPHAANIDTMAFNNVRRALAMSSFDGELFTVEAQSLEKSPRVRAHASQMAVSANGKTLITGTKKGAVQIREFVGLELLHTIPYEDEEIIGLHFASSSLRFLDIRRSVFNVWEPAALVRRLHDDDSKSSAGQSSFTSAASQRREVAAKSDKSAVAAMVEHPSGDYVFCAKESGSISIYETLRAKAKLNLFDFGKSLVSFLAWNEPLNLLASADNSGTVKVHRLGKTPQRGSGGAKDAWQPDPKQILETQCKEPIRQLLFSLDGNLLLVSTVRNEHIFSTNERKLLRKYPSTSTQRFQKWIACPWDNRRLLEVGTGPVHSISWVKSRASSPIFQDVNPHVPWQYDGGNAHLVLIGDRTWAACDDNPSSNPVVWSMPHNATDSEETIDNMKSKFLSRFADIAPYILNILGLYKRRLIFLGSDNWICSIGVDEPTLDDATAYHFPLPRYWGGTTRALLAFVSSKGEVVIALNSDLTIVRRVF